MSPRNICLIVALLFVAAFCVSLTFDWHGVFAVASAVGFFLFVAGSTRSGNPARRIFGGILFAYAIPSFFGHAHHNLVFLSTIAAGGAILFLNPVALFFTRETNFAPKANRQRIGKD